MFVHVYTARLGAEQRGSRYCSTGKLKKNKNEPSKHHLGMFADMCIILNDT